VGSRTGEQVDVPTPAPSRQCGVFRDRSVCYDRRVRFEWDPRKATANLGKHGVSFEEASTVFGDPLATTVPDRRHSVGEHRWLTTGLTDRQRVVIVWHVDDGSGAVVRVIGAREATPRERRTYESGE